MPIGNGSTSNFRSQTAREILGADGSTQASTHRRTSLSGSRHRRFLLKLIGRVPGLWSYYLHGGNLIHSLDYQANLACARGLVRTQPHEPSAISVLTRYSRLREGHAADLAAIFSATLVSAIARMKRCVRSARASLSARQLSSRTPTA